MIVVATWPVMRRLQVWLWGSRTLAVTAMTAVWLLVLVAAAGARHGHHRLQR